MAELVIKTHHYRFRQAGLWFLRCTGWVWTRAHFRMYQGRTRVSASTWPKRGRLYKITPAKVRPTATSMGQPGPTLASWPCVDRLPPLLPAVWVKPCSSLKRPGLD